MQLAWVPLGESRDEVRFTESQIPAVLAKREADVVVAEILRGNGISKRTYSSGRRNTATPVRWSGACELGTARVLRSPTSV